jgi:hypothetical protein
MVAQFASLLAIATLAISSIAAQAPTTNLVGGQCVSNYDASIDYFPQKLNTGKYNSSSSKRENIFSLISNQLMIVPNSFLSNISRIIRL